MLNFPKNKEKLKLFISQKRQNIDGLKNRLKSLSKFKKIIVSVVFLSTVATLMFAASRANEKNQSSLDSHKISNISGLDGKLAYISGGELRVRDYNSKEDYSLGDSESSENLKWSPEGKYLTVGDSNKFNVFSIESRNRVDVKKLCGVNKIDQIKWTGKTDLLGIKDNNTFYFCDLKGYSNEYSLMNTSGSILDWVPINKEKIIALIDSSIMLIDLTSKEVIPISQETDKITKFGEKYLWFASNKSFVYQTVGKKRAAIRVILSDQYRFLDKMEINFSEDLEPLGFDVGPCNDWSNELVAYNKTNKEGRIFAFGSPKSSFREHKVEVIVQPGDTYWDIAERLTGDGNNWRELGFDLPGDGFAVRKTPVQLDPGSILSFPSSELVKEINGFQVVYDEIPFKNDKAILVSYFEKQTPAKYDVIRYDNLILREGYDFRHNEIMQKYAPNKIFFSPQREYVSKPREYAVLTNDRLDVYDGEGTVKDSLEGVANAIWDWSPGYCYNHKYGELYPETFTQELDLDQSDELTCIGRSLPVLGYEIRFEDVCEEGWEQSNSADSVIFNKAKLGINLIVTEHPPGTIDPKTLRLKTDEGYQYDFEKTSDNTYVYKIYFDHKPYSSFHAEHTVTCTETTQGDCEKIVPNFVF